MGSAQKILLTKSKRDLYEGQDMGMRITLKLILKI
jgi:hypothetical protein